MIKVCENFMRLSSNAKSEFKKNYPLTFELFKKNVWRVGCGYMPGFKLGDDMPYVTFTITHE